VGSIGLCYWHPGVSTLKASQDPVGVKWREIKSLLIGCLIILAFFLRKLIY
jgi:hypothetical protein